MMNNAFYFILKALFVFKVFRSLFRYFNFEPSFKVPWCCARDLFGSQIPVTKGGFELPKLAYQVVA